nr:MAG TPA: lysin [Caudoviricetes sp.]
MTTQKQLLDKLESVVNQRLTVPTNPFGGQCVAAIDRILHYEGLFNLDFSYVNAIDCLDRAANIGLKVTYFNGSNRPPIGSVWVSNCWPYHEFGHIGFVVGYTVDGGIITIEQNIDSNADALYNGGWTRKVIRNLSSDGTFSYVNWQAPAQQMLGWFELPFDAPKADIVIKNLEDLKLMKEFIVTSKKYGYGVFVGGKYVGLSDIKSVNSMKDRLGFAIVELGDDDFLRFSKAHG